MLSGWKDTLIYQDSQNEHNNNNNNERELKQCHINITRIAMLKFG